MCSYHWKDVDEVHDISLDKVCIKSLKTQADEMLTTKDFSKIGYIGPSLL